jgi:beta-glucosidase-like glycosyl hydrolase
MSVVSDDKNLFKNDNLIENEENANTNTNSNTKNKKIIFTLIIILFIIIIITILLIVFLMKDEETNAESDYPIPKNEDLNFTEENHRLLSREAATQTMVLATNNGGLPLQSTDQVVLFGSGTENTIYGGWDQVKYMKKEKRMIYLPLKY